MQKISISDLAKILLPVTILGCAIYFASTIRSKPLHNTSDEPVLITTYPPNEYPVIDASLTDAGAGVADAGAVVVSEPVKVRPTAQQLVKEFLLFELKDLEKQATTPEDKELIQKAIEIKYQRLKEIELSNDFEENMKKAVK